MVGLISSGRTHPWTYGRPIFSRRSLNFDSHKLVFTVGTPMPRLERVIRFRYPASFSAWMLVPFVNIKQLQGMLFCSVRMTKTRDAERIMMTCLRRYIWVYVRYTFILGTCRK